MANSPEEIQKAKKTYIWIFLALLVCTVVTVLVATQEWLDFGRHGFDHVDAIVGLAIATLKASLVGAIFMHLNHEKKSIYWIFFGAFVFALALFGLTAFAEFDPIFDPHFFGK
ncbi:cytochrome C oxidase subunit IV family protein [Luteolibacter sp. SL250]|uniref:cytochrome C oxidase subunit IV family protein n=1 Tax=Luteolibacter sp. SL250 TaxID=2995170 RepID=UPI00226F3542|nr:cytochrome C oxidase subunit IV family protein [Luteolibacter sp. SL250]WAC19236.1 cytochrome C oxidase subunit IV family protein [Luteolibacter sp. SL250]